MPKRLCVPSVVPPVTNEPGTSPAVPPAAMSGAMGFAPLEFLITLLINISRMDSDGFFEEPVREEDAPGYYDVIKQPMCFQRMKDKLRGREYRTWRGLVADFELICSNAMTYNQKRSRVHKSALSMLRAGKKQLQAAELEGRKAVALLHPEGPTAAAADEAREAAEAEQAAAAAARHPAKVAKMALRQGSLISDAPSGTPKSGVALPPRLGSASLQPAVPADTPSCTDVDDFQFDMHSDRDEAYSSFSGSDAEDAEGASLAASFWLPHMGSTVDVQPCQPGPDDAGHPQAQSGSRRSSAWKHRRRKTEWKARWLELRLRELRRQQARYEDQLAALRKGAAARASNPASPSEQTLPAAAGEPQQPGSSAKPVSDNQQSVEAADQAQSSPSQAAGTPAGTAETPGVDADRVVAQLRRRHDRQQARELAATGLLEHPFFAALAGVRTSKQVVVETSKAEQQVERETFPACAYAALEFCQRHLAAVKKQLVQQPGQRQRPQKRVAGPPKARPRGGTLPGMRSMPTRKSSMLGLAAKPSMERCSSAKRRRNDYDVGDMIMPHMSGAGGPKFVERVQVAEINTPEVRLLPEGELMQREATVAAFRCHLKSQGQVQMPDELQEVLRGQPGEGSSSEDTSDEAYATRHRPFEDEERQRFLGVSGGGAQKRNMDDKGKGVRTQNGKLQRNESFAAVDSAQKQAESRHLSLSAWQQEAPTPASAEPSPAAAAPAQPGLESQVQEQVPASVPVAGAEQQLGMVTPQPALGVLNILTPGQQASPMDVDAAPAPETAQQKGSGGALRRGRPPGSKTRRKLSNGKTSRGRGRGRGGRGGRGACNGNGVAQHTERTSPGVDEEETPESSIDVEGEPEGSTEVVVTDTPASAPA
ncbi:probable Bromodomain-containing protein 9 at N-terminal half [Coccomyxa sp. Obi]|nr:probable Bromodomain-containing protein 9 at N-terminal half [Coccomyxa sp. Obi]